MKGMFGLLLMGQVVASPTGPGIENKADVNKKPHSLTLAIAKADQLLSRIHVNRWSDAPNDRVKAALSTIIASGVFNKPQTMMMKVHTAYARDDGIVVRGQIRARRKKLHEYRAAHEKDVLLSMSKERTSLKKEHDNRLLDKAQYHRERSYYDNRRGEREHDIELIHRKISIERKQMDGEHKRAKTDLNLIAKERQTEYEQIQVEVIVPNELAGDVARIAQASRISVTILVDYIALRPPMLEVKKAMAIGFVRGTATKIPDRLRRQP